MYLSRFDFVLKHIPGSKMGKADRLSRRSDWEKGGDRDNEEKVLLKPDVRSANSKPELSQLLFISVRQRELVRVLASLVYLLIHNLLGLCT